MPVSATKLRDDLFNILDEVLETGVPVEVRRKGKLLKIVPEEMPSKLSRLKKPNVVVGDPDDLVEIDWSQYWTELK